MKSLITHIVKILLLILFLSSISIGQTEQEEKLAVQRSDSVFVMEKSPLGAVLRSAVLPGWGQFYTESYWKIPVIWGAIGYFVYIWIDNNDNYKKYRVLYAESDLTNNDYERLRDFYRDQRDEFAIYIGLTYFLQLVDAYVGAHLFDFDVTPNPITKSPEVQIKFYF